MVVLTGHLDIIQNSGIFIFWASEFFETTRRSEFFGSEFSRRPEGLSF